MLISIRLVDSHAMQRRLTYKELQNRQPVPRGDSSHQVIGSFIVVLMIVLVMTAPVFTAGAAVGAVTVATIHRIDITAQDADQGDTKSPEPGKPY